MADWTLNLGDCLEPATGLASLSDKSVDVVLTDPPYSEHTHEKQRSGAKRAFDGSACARRRRPGGARYRDLGFEHITQETIALAAQHFARIARRWVLVFTDAENVSAWIAALRDADLEHVRVGAWVKPGAPPQFTGDRPATGFEAIEIAHPPGRKRWNGGGNPGLWTVPTVGGGERCHTTQKPLLLMEQIVRDFSDPGELVCDPFSGSGTTGAACIRNGRRFVGWERDRKYFSTAQKRLAGTREQIRMFDSQPTEGPCKQDEMEFPETSTA